MLIYSMFIAGIVEVSYNWELFLGLSLLTVVGKKAADMVCVDKKKKVRRIRVKA